MGNFSVENSSSRKKKYIEREIKKTQTKSHIWMTFEKAREGHRGKKGRWRGVKAFS